MYYLYWIKAKHHTDIDVQGYIGITKDFDERMRGHKKNKRRGPLTSAIRKYGWDNLEKIVILKGMDIDSALFLEQVFRPNERVGWNNQRGGKLGVNPEWYGVNENRRIHSKATSEATKLGILRKDTTEARAERARKNWIDNRESYKNISKGSNNPRAILNEDQVREIKYKLIPQGFSNQEIANVFNVKHYVISFIRSGKNWSHI